MQIDKAIDRPKDQNLSEAAASLRDLAGELKGNPSLLFRERRPAPLDETR